MTKSAKSVRGPGGIRYSVRKNSRENKQNRPRTGNIAAIEEPDIASRQSSGDVILTVLLATVTMWLVLCDRHISVN